MSWEEGRKQTSMWREWDGSSELVQGEWELPLNAGSRVNP